jgi:tRNA(Ile)-lysidine synthase
VSLVRLELGADASETEAREARYRWLRAECARLGAHGILTAHHADDQAETVLMRALRGSGPAGLAGMARRTPDVVRPLLPFRREELAQYLLDRGIASWTDPSNLDPKHLRSWIRADVLPVLERRLPDVTERLLALAAQARGERDAWDAVLDLLPELGIRVEHGGVSLEATALASLPEVLLVQLVRVAARRAGAMVSPAAARRAVRLARDGTSGQQVDLGGGWSAESSFGRLVLGRAAPAEADRVLQTPGETRWCGWRIACHQGPAGPVERGGWQGWLPTGELSVGAPRIAERIRPLGGTGSRLISRLLQEARVPRGARATWPVLRCGGEAVWVPGVSRSELCVPEPGRKAVRIDVERA